VDSFYPLWSGGTKADKVNPLSANVPSVTSTAEEKPLRRDAARNRQRILDAARELFAQRGLSATLNDIAHHAGVGVGTVYRRFPDKSQLIDGLFEHHDSNGGGGLITDGDTQWMTAGAGILHIETPPEYLVASGGLFHGFQLWVNLPQAMKFAAPRYQDIRASEVSLIASPDGGVLLRVIAGKVAGHPGPGITHTPIALVHATLSPGASLTLPWQPEYNALVYTLAGRGSVGRGSGGTGRRPISIGQLAVFGDGDTITIAADQTQETRSPTMDVLILGGQPIREPVAMYGPFVMNTKAEVMQAFEDYQAGRLGTIPAAHAGVEGSTPDS